MKTNRFNTKEWIAKVYYYIEYLFDEEDEKLEAPGEAKPDKIKGPEPQATHDSNGSDSDGWNLLTFLDLVQSIILILPILGYTSSHWTIYHVQNTRELHQHIFGTAAFLIMGLFFLFLAFPKIMRVLLFATTLLVGTLPLLSKQHHYSTFLERYLGHVKSIPAQLDNYVQGYVFYADQISDKLKDRVVENIDHKNIRDYLDTLSRYSPDNDSVNKELPDYLQAIKLYQMVNEGWKYKSDPFHKDKFRPPHRTINSLSGDCDDYTLLISTLYLSLGYDMRIIMTTGHVYPEMAIPDKAVFEYFMAPLIIACTDYLDDGSSSLCYHIDNDGTIWLNMDYTASYPGGPFMFEPVLKIIYFDDV